MHKTLLTALAVLLLGAPTFAAPFLIDNLYVGTNDSAGSDPFSFVTVGDRVIFRDNADTVWSTDGTDTEPLLLDEPFFDSQWIAYVDDDHAVLAGFEKTWITDGTPDGTVELGIVLDNPSDDPRVALADGRLVLMGLASTGGRLLYVSDGTAAGTEAIPGPSTTDLRFLTAFGDHAVFFEFLDDGAARTWRTDGSVAGTVAFHDWPDTPFFEAPVAVDDFLLVPYFDQPTGNPRFAMWAIDRSFTVAPISDANWFSVQAFANLGERALWTGSLGPDSLVLITSDGTEVGTQTLGSFNGFTPAPPIALGVDDGTLVFAIDTNDGRELWVSDGTVAGTGLLVDICPGSCRADPEVLGDVGSTFVVIADDGTSGRELWRVDRLAGTATQLIDLCPGSCDGVIRTLAGRYVLGYDGSRLQLWTTDGTLAGTRRLTDFPGAVSYGDSAVIDDASARELLVFALDDAMNGSEPWVSDGTALGTRLLIDIVTDGAAGSRPEWLGTAGDLAIFRTRTLGQQGLWATDGSRDGTIDLGLTSDQALQIASSHAAIGRTFFVITDDSPIPLWVSDGTIEGTREISRVDGFPIFRDGLETDTHFFFPSTVGEMWVSDGSEARSLGVEVGPRALMQPFGNGVVMLDVDRAQLMISDGATVEPVLGTPPVLDACVATVHEDIVFFSDQADLWVSDGTPGGARQLVDFTDGTMADRTICHQVAEQVFFTLTRSSQSELWVSDGTVPGTRPLAGFEPPVLLDRPVTTSNRLFFAVDGADTALWTSDGSVAGTREIATLGPMGTSVFYRATLDDTLFYQSSQDNQLWATDGTTVVPLEGVSTFEAIILPDHIVFRGRPVTGGTGQLWVSDGTALGTRNFDDLFPNEPPAINWELGVATASRLFFSGVDEAGLEPWAVTLTELGAGALDLTADGRFSVAVTWDAPDGTRGYGTPEGITDDTGTFYFFDQDNLELMVKVLDGRAINGHWWVFYASLSNVGFTLTVTDSETGELRTYENTQGTFASRGDTKAFPNASSEAFPNASFGAFSDAPQALTVQPAGVAPRMSDCGVPDALCLNNGRFAVHVDFQDFDGIPGQGAPVPLTDDTGAFWFFDDANLEMMVTVLDGTAINGRWWVFYGGLSNVAYTLTVTDTTTGAVRIYENPAGSFGSRGDTGAF
ncbi:MAG: hypothetical protein AAGD38_13810 [Acidobacteriota bacterium]